MEKAASVYNCISQKSVDIIGIQDGGLLFKAKRYRAVEAIWIVRYVDLVEDSDLIKMPGIISECAESACTGKGGKIFEFGKLEHPA